MRQVGILGSLFALLSFAYFDRVVTWYWLIVPLLLFGAASVVTWLSWRRPWEWEEEEPAALSRTTEVPELSIRKDTLFTSAALFATPTAFVDRIVHEVTPDEGYFINNITQSVRIPAVAYLDESGRFENEHPCYIPILYPERGSLVDNLRIASDGAQLSEVPSGIARTLTYHLLWFITSALFEGHPQPIRDLVDEQLRDLASVLVTDASVVHDKTFLEKRKEALVVLRKQLGPPQDEEWTERRNKALQLWEAAFSSYVAFGEICASPGDSIKFTVTYTKPFGEDEPSWRWRFWIREQKARGRSRFTPIKETVRYILSLRPPVYRFPLAFVRATKSYHLWFSVPRDQYVAKAAVLHRVRVGDEIHDVTEKTHLVVGRATRQNTIHYAHVYLRPLPEEPRPDAAATAHDAEPEEEEQRETGEFVARVAVIERPPGILGLVALLSILQLALIGVVLCFYSYVFVSDNATFPALLLATPGLIAAWLANQLVPGRLQRVALMTIAGITLNGVVAFASTWLAVLAVGGFDPWEFSIGRVHVSHTLWYILLVFTFWFTGNIVGRWTQRMNLYMARLRRPPKPERYTV